MSTTMSGLRVYVDSPSPTGTGPIGIEVGDTAASPVFYSRRRNGPIYRWRYEANRKHWRALRMNTSEFETHKLANASWKSVPETLQLQLGAHYLD